MGIAAGISAGASLIGARKQKKAGKEAQRLADQNAARQRKETEETVRRTGASQRQAFGLTRAAGAASGIRGGGSTAQYLEEMQKTFQEDLDWITESGGSQESIMRAEGRLAKKQASAGAWGTIASGVGALGDYWK